VSAGRTFARRGLAAPGCSGPYRLRAPGRAAAPGGGAAPGPAPGRIGLRALSRSAGVASRAGVVGRLLGRHLSLPALRPTMLDFLVVAIPMFCFGYPFVMAWYWMV